MRQEVNALAVSVGKDPLLVQGAGGNISWKDGEFLYVKGSGTWLVDAEHRDIYVQMHLKSIYELISKGEENYLPAIVSASEGARPSIETALHALLPHKVVLHLHPVDVIALSVLPDGLENVTERLDGLDWAWIDYAKPGKELADVVKTRIATCGYTPRVLILKNHGLVIAEESVPALCSLLTLIVERLKLSPRSITPTSLSADVDTLSWYNAGYRVVQDNIVSTLAFDQRLIELSRTAWVLYPDHAVFLGSECGVYLSPDEIPKDDSPIVVIVPGKGVLLKKTATLAAESMLRCYSEVLFRLYDDEPTTLSHSAIAALLNWDAEKFRQSIQRDV
ncbi:class II aldolase/adducin family protein [Dickeya zeae]|uniref:class II aldolase/adducin family protein n=1 Tax=Dickeya zeae TaxID=204042 RepID=UPI00035D0A0A|nr:class II aldolase/adducin family protein [Dickeya zeae]UJR53175.1 class II aldolase [Dickeya zeae MS1]